MGALEYGKKENGPMAGLYDVSGKEGNIKYSVVQQSTHHFLLSVEKPGAAAEESYQCTYPTIFGVDAEDVARIEEKLDHMIKQIRTA